jgi:hypothetical protein
MENCSWQASYPTWESTASQNYIGNISWILGIWIRMSQTTPTFMYVTKTRANLTTYSRKLENYNGTIIFEIDIMKKSTPINLNLCQTWLFHKVFGCFFCFDLLWSWAESAVNPGEKKCYFSFDSGKKCEFLIESGWVHGAIVIPRFSTICG